MFFVSKTFKWCYFIISLLLFLFLFMHNDDDVANDDDDANDEHSQLVGLQHDVFFKLTNELVN